MLSIPHPALSSARDVISAAAVEQEVVRIFVLAAVVGRMLLLHMDQGHTRAGCRGQVVQEVRVLVVEGVMVVGEGEGWVLGRFVDRGNRSRGRSCVFGVRGWACGVCGSIGTF